MNANRSLDLDCDAPEIPSEVLRAAAERYYESAGELASAWQDRNAGRIWADYARILERAADAMDKARTKRGL